MDGSLRVDGQGPIFETNAAGKSGMIVVFFCAVVI